MVRLRRRRISDRTVDGLSVEGKVAAFQFDTMTATCSIMIARVRSSVPKSMQRRFDLADLRTVVEVEQPPHRPFGKPG